MQVGRGVQVADIQRLFNQGTLKQTGLNTDLAIEGEGFFVVHDASGKPLYTRKGAFTINPSQYLHDPSTGYILQGVRADFTTFEVPTGGPVQDVYIPVGTLTIAKDTDTATFDGNLNGGGDIAADGSVLLSETLYDSNINTTATESTLLTNLGRSSSSNNFQDMNIATGDVITINAKKGGRTVTPLTFTVGSPPPQGGTTLGDLRAAKDNGVLFYPILPGAEESSWERFYKEGTMKAIIKKPLRPTEEEGKINPRARSARFRVAERT